MRREDFYFESRDEKTKLHAVRWEPDNKNPIAVVQIIHGMAEHVGRYEKFAEFLVSKNFVVTAEDHLGHGLSIVDDKKGYFCKNDPATVVVKDVHRLKKLTQEKFPGIPYFILGHSMGSFILRNYLFGYGKGIDGAIIIGTGMTGKTQILFLKFMAFLGSVFGHAQRPSEFISRIAFGAYQKRINNPRTEYDWLTRDDKAVDEYLSDELSGFLFPCNGFKTLADLILRLHKKNYVAKMPVTLRVLIAGGTEDPVGDYGQAPKNVYKAFVSEGMQKVELKLYENDRHEILNEMNKEAVYEDIYQWMIREGF